MLPKAKTKEVLNWFIRAKRDLTIANMNLANNPPITDDAVFHCQQAVEKALKGFLVLHDRPFKKTHIIGDLSPDVLRIAPTLEPLLKQATELTPYATMFRYPGELDLPSLEDSSDALVIAQRVFDAIICQVPAEALPPK